MGTLGKIYFESDTASDYLATLHLHRDATPLIILLETVISEEDYLEVDLGQEAVAAIAITAGFNPNFDMQLPEDIRSWLRTNQITVSSGLVDLAKKALNRTLQEDSELLELWRENEEEFPQWRRDIENLRRGLQFTP